MQVVGLGQLCPTCSYTDGIRLCAPMPSPGFGVRCSKQEFNPSQLRICGAPFDARFACQLNEQPTSVHITLYLGSAFTCDQCPNCDYTYAGDYNDLKSECYTDYTECYPAS